jgi:hypothetical protein
MWETELLYIIKVTEVLFGPCVPWTLDLDAGSGHIVAGTDFPHVSYNYSLWVRRAEDQEPMNENKILKN